MTESDNARHNEAEKLANGQQRRLKSVLNGMDALICVCDAETFEILFLNDSIRANFGIEEDGVGRICYELLQHRTEPCESCPYREIHEHPDKPLVWEHHESVKNRVLRKTARLIDWDDGRKAHLEYAIDITELRIAQSTLERQNHLSQLVNQVSAILFRSGGKAFEENLLRSMGVIAEAAGADRAYIWENHTRDGELYCSQIYEWSEGAEPQQGKDLVEAVSYKEVLPEWLKTLSQGYCVNSLVSGLSASERELLSAQGILSILVVPIFLDGRFWGFVGFDDCHSERVFSDKEEAILRSASELFANALIRDNLEKIADKINYDPLTGIYNRRYLDEKMAQLISALSRSESMLSVMMVDIDFFKKYNDTYGHGQGDECLKAIANTLKNTVSRTDDFVVRYGGEEFVVVLPNTCADGANLVARKLLDAVRQCGIPHEKNTVADCVTVSIGVTTGTALHTYDAATYIRRADEMLYVAKGNGRNRHVYANLEGI
jgi:diguanylate cyclase (GGDEF)-like protein